jgi:retron-type reverse transcriptase
MANSAGVHIWGLPKITGIDDLTMHIHLSKFLIWRLVNNTGKFYRQVQIPKRNGTYRRIDCPSKTLTAVQRWILRSILERVPAHASAMAYYPGATPKKNAMRHARNYHMLAYDLKDFFPSIGRGRVFTIFRALGYSDHVCHLLSSLCTLDDRLPQGAPTSPMISNIVCRKMDSRLARLAGLRSVAYTRYSDDITFTAKTSRQIHRVQALSKQIVAEEGFALNSHKTRVVGRGHSLSVTGLAVLGDGQVRITREYRRRIRAAVFRSVMEDDRRKVRQINTQIRGFEAHWTSIEKNARAVTSRWRGVFKRKKSKIRATTTASASSAP